MNHQERAAELFVEGYNCAQALAGAFCDVTGLAFSDSVRMVSGFGGGMGRMREVCGAVSGMVFVVSQRYGYDAPDPQKQKELYTIVQQLGEEFQKEAGSLVCRELLRLPRDTALSPNPTARTAEFYAQRPCARFVMLAARLLDAYLQK